VYLIMHLITRCSNFNCIIFHWCFFQLHINMVWIMLIHLTDSMEECDSYSVTTSVETDEDNGLVTHAKRNVKRKMFHDFETAGKIFCFCN